MCSWWDVSQALAEGILDGVLPGLRPTVLVHHRWTVTSPKVVLTVNGRVPRVLDNDGRLCRGGSLQDQLLVGLLDEGSEEPWLDSKAGLMDAMVRPRSGRVLVLDTTGQQTSPVTV